MNRAVRVELVEQGTGYLLAAYRPDESGELVWCEDTGVLCDLDAINGVLGTCGMRIDAAPSFWRDCAVASMLEAIDYRREMKLSPVFGDFEIRPRLRQGRSQWERQQRDSLRRSAA